MTNKFQLSPKYIDFINCIKNVDADFLEGTTSSGKTTIGAGVKFMAQVSRSKKKMHIIASKTTGNAEKNIINQDNGILDLHHNATYFGNGDKDYKFPHIKFENKIILIMGYDTRDKWENALGGQYGCVLIDEINTADMDFVREISARNDYMIATLNPDDPAKPIYKEYINRSRPYQKYIDDVPREILNELTEDPVKGWRYWFFTFNDNLGLTDEKKEQIKKSVPKGTKMYKNKIQGLRGRATGLVFINFDENEHIITKEEAKKMHFVQFSCGVDTAYSSKSPDTIAFQYQGITNKGELIVLDEKVYNNASLAEPIAPSDTVDNLIAFMKRNNDEWGACRNIYIDSADQATKTEFQKYKRKHPNVYSIFDAWKKTTILSRINLVLGWLETGHYMIVDTCTEHIREMQVYSWQENKDSVPEDSNDHTINAGQYGWLPYKNKIGIENSGGR